MKNLLIIIILSLSCFSLKAQHKPDFLSDHLQCSTCHVCDVPTKNNPCLRPCIREHLVTVEHSADEAPAIIKIDRFVEHENHYLPALFTHKLHAEMSNLSGGCITCHHYNPPGRILTCIECHEVNRSREDVSKPDLKAAYHRQCINCHRAWSHQTDCEECHAELTEENKDLVLSTDHKPVTVHPQKEEPGKLVYTTEFNEGVYVTFYHNEHTDLYGIQCQSCHTQESCIKCHDLDEDKKKNELRETDLHEKCSSCHNIIENCNFCHSEKERKEFSHLRRTGWDISEYHKKLECINCHEQKRVFTGLSKNCLACHNNWNSETFDHSITGLELDEIHIENDCTDCHGEDTFTSPGCENCHDEDIVYPDYVPGTLTKK